jgi:hypothetical protein
MNLSRAIRPRHKTLRVQADVPHTFGTLLIPLALILVAWGIFLVERTIANPLASDVSGILFGSVVLACGLLLIAYLVRAVRVSAISRSQENRVHVERLKPRLIVRRAVSAEKVSPSSHSFHRGYVDDVRISL